LSGLKLSVREINDFYLEEVENVDEFEEICKFVSLKSFYLTEINFNGDSCEKLLDFICKKSETFLYNRGKFDEEFYFMKLKSEKYILHQINDDSFSIILKNKKVAYFIKQLLSFQIDNN